MPRSGLETAWALTPAAVSRWMTPVQPVLSAKAPWTSATVGPVVATMFGSVMTISSSGRTVAGSARQEGEQVVVELRLVRPGESVRGAGVDLERRVLHQPDRLPRRSND